jgi:hypothetical protein
MKIALVLLVGTLILSTCASTKFGHADSPKRTQVELVGRSKKDMLMGAAVPARSEEVDI